MKLKRTLIPVVMPLALSLLFSTAKAEEARKLGVTAGAYTEFSFDKKIPLRSVSFRNKIEKDPGSASNVYWSNQFIAANTGYIGFQSNGPSQARTFLMSFWGRSNFRPGSPGSYCLIFTGEGVGASCRMRHDIVEGHIYRQTITLKDEINNNVKETWLTGKILDESTNEEFTLGSIQVDVSSLPADISSWVEYFEWSDPGSSCFDQPYARSLHFFPTANSGQIKAQITSTKPTNNACKDMVSITPSDQGSIMALNIGNSLKKGIAGLDGKLLTAAELKEGSPVSINVEKHTIINKFAGDSGCLDIVNGNPNVGASLQNINCSAHAAQTWSYENNQLKSELSGLCLSLNSDTPGSAASMKSCENKDSLQSWTFTEGKLKNNGTGLCLDLRGKSLTKGTLGQVAICDSSLSQSWVLSDGSYTNRWTVGKDETIRTRSGFCLAVKDDLNINGSKIELANCSNSLNKKWEVVNGSIRHKASGKCLDIPDFSTKNGTELQLFSCNGSTAQRWSTPVTP